ncbi:MAG TPA: AAA family ATPase [Actinomycetales bacterium]|nr:AAA family ATPase [Actinomycetales bacterium]
MTQQHDATDHQTSEGDRTERSTQDGRIDGRPVADQRAVHGTELEREQRHLDLVYRRVDELSDLAEERLREVQRGGASGTHQARSERDSFAQALAARVAQLRSVQDRLCFGRLDLRDGQRHHIGRLGLSDEQQQKLLVDWRAPVAAPFYQATPAAPGDVVRRRHLTTRGREVVHLEDEVLDLDSISSAERVSLQGEGALMAAVTAPRTGRMGDIVATIQGEQDSIVRDELPGVLVVQGGPGTGKTAVALHRAAYLLFTYRQRLGSSGVLVVGPGRLFLRYIEQVLPSLGESGVVMATPGSLFPGVDAVGDDTDEVALLKGDPRMARVLARAVRDRQKLPDTDLQLKVGSHRIVLTREAVAASRSRARGTGAPHNAARVTFVKDMLRHLAGELAAAMGQGLDDDLRAELDADLRDSRDVRVNLNLLWMPLTPERFLRDLWAVPVRLASAAPGLSEAERELLHRDRDQPWTVSDVPLLDELAELLGDDGEAVRIEAKRAAAERAAEQEYARGVLQLTQGVANQVGDGMLAGVTAEMLAGRFGAAGSSATVAERAGNDRTWTFGHLVVDEAQEISPMMWRLLQRRCPSRSWTVVGDLAQRASVAGASSWHEALERVAPGRVRVRELTVSYRTPGRVMAVADAMAEANGLPVTAVVSVREGEHDPVRIRRDERDVDTVVRAVMALAERRGGGASPGASSPSGTVAVVAPVGETAGLLEGLEKALPGQVGDARRALDALVSVLAPEEAKGLEFDDVVVVEPAEVVAASRRGASDLYVALSRPTDRLVVVHHEPLPPGMAEHLVVR